MDSRFYFLFSCALLAGCMPTRQPSPDAFMQSELMPPKEEVAIIEETKKDDDRSILEEILAAIKAPLVTTAPQEAPQPVAQQQTPQPPQQTLQPAQQQAMQPAQQATPQPSVPPAQSTPPPVVLPQPSANIMPQILQAAPSGHGGGSPFFQTIVLPQMAPFAYPAPMPMQQAQPQAPFYSTPSTQTQNYTPQAPAQNAPIQPVQQSTQQTQEVQNQTKPQPTQSVQQVQNVAQVQPNTKAQPVMDLASLEPSYTAPEKGYSAQPYVPYNANEPSDNYYPISESAEVILPDTYQLPAVQQQPVATHVMSGQEAYPIWQGDELYYEEILPAPTPAESSSLKSENINIPRW